MRYVAKVHVLDVLCDVVVSGYVYDADTPDGEAPEVHEFSWVVPGRGVDDWQAWLLTSIYGAYMAERTRLGRDTPGGLPMGAS